MKRCIEFIKFSAVGGAMTVLNFVLFYIMNEYWGMYYIVSNILSYIIAVVLSYFLNLWVTFNKKIKSRTAFIRSFAEYVMMRALFLGADSGLLYVAVQMIGVDKYLAKAVITVLMLFLSYSCSRAILTGRN